MEDSERPRSLPSPLHDDRRRTAVKLRPYQIRAILYVRASIKSGKLVTFVSPSGAGKVKPL